MVKLKMQTLKLVACTRVPVIDGHTESVFVETEKEIDPSLAKDTFNDYNKDISVTGLPSAPEKYYAFHDDPTLSLIHI